MFNFTVANDFITGSDENIVVKTVVAPKMVVKPRTSVECGKKYGVYHPSLGNNYFGDSNEVSF